MPETGGHLRLAYDPDGVGEMSVRLARLAGGRGDLRVAFRGGEPGERVFLAHLLAGRLARSLHRVDLRAMLRGDPDKVRRAIDAQMADLRGGRAAILFENAEALEAPLPADASRPARNLRSRFLAQLRQSRGVAILSYGAAAPAGARARGRIAAEVAFDAETASARSADRRPSGRAGTGRPFPPATGRPAVAAPAASAPSGSDTVPGVAYNFRVNIGRLDLGFCAVSAFGSDTDLESVETEDLAPGAGAMNAGFTRFRPVRLRRALTGSKALFAWRNEILKGKADVRDIGIRQLDPMGRTVVNAWILAGAWPTRWTGPDFDSQISAIAFEEIEVLYRDILWL